jgi:hypothetical protein
VTEFSDKRIRRTSPAWNPWELRSAANVMLLWQEDELLLAAGDPVDKIFFLMEGSVAVFRDAMALGTLHRVCRALSAHRF